MTTTTDPAKKLQAPWRLSMAALFLFLYFLPSTLGNGLGPYSFVILAPLYLLLFGLFVLMQPGFNIRIRGAWEMTYFLGLPVLAGVWAGILGTTNALVELLHLTLGAVTILLMMWLFRDAPGIQRLVQAAKLGGGILAVRALAEYMFGVTPTGGWGNPNYLTTYFALLSPILWVEALGLVGRVRWKSIMLLSLFLLVTIIAGSRANLLGMMVQGCVVGWHRMATISGIRQYILRGVFILLVLTVGLGVMQDIISEGGQKSLTEQVEKGGKASAFVRAIMIYDGLRLFWKSGGLGMGAGNVTYEYSSQPKFGKHVSSDTIYPLHNFPVQLAAQYGVPGLLLFGTSYLSLLLSLHRRGRRSRAPPTAAAQTVEVVRRSGWAFLVSFVLISISVSYLFDRRPFYLAFGLYLTVNQYLLRQEASTSSGA